MYGQPGNIGHCILCTERLVTSDVVSCVRTGWSRQTLYLVYGQVGHVGRCVWCMGKLVTSDMDRLVTSDVVSYVGTGWPCCRPDRLVETVGTFL